MRRRHHATAVLLAAALLGLTACDGDPAAAPAPATPSASPTPDAGRPAVPAPSAPPDALAAGDLERVVREYSGHYFAGEGASAYVFLSARCRVAAGDAAAFADTIGRAAREYGPQEIATLTVDRIAGDTARVTYTYAVPGLDRKEQPWTREGGAWKYDAC
ncbi:hypothetical protein [Streptomyces sp. NPDC048606]|uniref:hypothetical protein n=1 Tax=Streptomyces sp. NPDC048606 TaxID=3154726 RepID=UPI00343481B1